MVKNGHTITTDDIGYNDHSESVPFSLPFSPISDLQAQFDNKYGKLERYKIADLDGPTYFGMGAAPDAGGGHSHPTVPVPLDPTHPALTTVVEGYQKISPFPTWKVNRNTTDLVLGAKDASQSALFSYTKDVSSGHDAFNAQGIAAADFGWDDVSPSNGSPYELHVIPSAEFQKITGQSDPKTDVDILNLRVGGEADWTDVATVGNDIFGITATSSLTYGTDFEWEKQVPGVEADFYPVLPHYFINDDLRPLKKDFWLSGDFIVDIHTEAGDVLDVGTSTTLKKGAYLRPGPKIGFVLSPTPNYDSSSKTSGLNFHASDFSIGASYLYYFQTIGSGGDAGVFDTYVEWKVNGSDKFSFKADYQNGKTPITLTRENIFTFGLGVKY